MLSYIIADVVAYHNSWTVNLTGMLFTMLNVTMLKKMLWSGINRYSLVYDLQPLLQKLHFEFVSFE